MSDLGGPGHPTAWCSPDADPHPGGEDEPRARQLAALEPPWGHGIDSSVLAATPTLVITGGWNPEYEAIAEVLADAGVSHVHLVGARHRPQDLPEFEDVLAGFTAG